MFCALALCAGTRLGAVLPPDLLLRLDPLAGVLTPVAARQWLPSLTPALAVLALALVGGRVFCGWLCPTGALFTLCGHGLRRILRGASPAARPWFGAVPCALLAALLAAALCGVNLSHWASPLPLLERLLALVLLPLGLAVADSAASALAPLWEGINATAVLYWHAPPRAFATAGLVATLWLTLVALEGLYPRCWCRYLCPAGALLGLVGRWAVWRRRAVRPHTCTQCGCCAAACPAGIARDAAPVPVVTCLACHACQDACPHGVLRFGPSTASPAPISTGRRAFVGRALLGGALLGLGAAAVVRADPVRVSAAPPSFPPETAVLRPPGALPEVDFLSRCLRCGACMQACPTGGLQPLWFAAGLDGLFSPCLEPRAGGCLPECAACGAACPSHAIRPLTLAQKRWAKLGTALVDEKTCLAWKDDKRCMVCKENCPYGAVDVVLREGHKVPVPIVHARRCYGCGFCEHHCPKAPTAIRVRADGALRPAGGDIQAAARAAGLELDPRVHQQATTGDSQNFSPQDTGPPPGFLP